jgi:hypothetical protein
MHPPLLDGHTQSVSPTSSDGKSQPSHAPQVGQVFVPRQVLNSGVFVPDSLLACRAISDGAKLLWARLARYAGARGQCFPLLSTVAADLGRSERQIQRYLAELIHEHFVVAQQRGFNKSNAYQFLWHPVFDLHRTTDLSPYSTTGLSSCVRTTDVSSCNGSAKNRIEMQAKPPRIVEVVEIPIDAACPYPQTAKRKPLTQEEAGVREQLERFQVELAIAGTILPSTVRRVMSSVPTEKMTEALRFVADKLYWRRRNESSYRRHVGWGFVLRVLEQDFAAPTRAEKRPVEPPANVSGTAPPVAVPQRRPPGSSGRRGGLVRAGDILSDLGLAAMENT